MLAQQPAGGRAMSAEAVHRSMSHSPWLWMSKAARERAISAAGASGVAIYLGLCSLESDAPKSAKDGFFASASNIARASGIGVRSVQRHLRALADAGLFTMTAGGKSTTSGAYEANRFRLLNVGPAVRQFGGVRTATESRDNGGQEISSPTESNKKKARPAGRSAIAAPAGGQGKTIDPDFDIY